ncbi:P-loop containing nucleoside triphosphate hydrolase protein [Apiospora arundinis]|uniref:P-loop containing nucleoside triphosphate hydrolase protein n=1 Tax=Apiospora arundinis TaxID=335852 RepID=A0ABR2IR89_9PEZI
MAQSTTDFIGGKGSGLIVLLHGGPGTGKTFTAKGVAEFAEKPLLRVTCGDVGTKAEEVEKKLQSSFHLGKIWDCVVLPDEADVFLEERDLKDLNRNALVSVFLRELEYHDGILILTSNRVGTFDEAFKSRIQLSLHYENLGISQRRKIWRNFMNRVKSLDPTIDYDDIIDHIEDLSMVEMNGREIRNAITTARQLAQFKEKALCYSILNHVLRVNGKFGRYLSDLRDGLTADDLKRESSLRLTYKTSQKRNKESPF